jgi:hypothetical protein
MKFLQGMMVAVLVFCGTAWAQDLQQIDIGTKGASLSAATDWKRVKLNADLGPDQFVSKRQLFLAVLEQEQVLSDPDEFDKALAVFAESIKVQDPTLVATSRRFASTQGMGHASTTFSCKLKGISLYYEIHMAGRDGLHYLFIGWSSVNEKLALAAEMRRIVASLKMPGPATKWGKEVAPSPVALRMNGYAYKFRVQKSLFNVIENPPAASHICRVVSKNEDMVCYLFPAQDCKSVEDQARDVVNLVRSDFREIKETARENVTVAGRKCLQIALAAINKQGAERFLVVTLIPLENSKCAEVRFLVSAKLEHRKGYLDAILKSLEIIEPARVDAFPEVNLAARKPVPALAPARRALLAASTSLATFEGTPTQVRRLPDGTLWSLGSDKAMVASPGASAPVQLVAFEDRCYTRHAAYRDGVLWYSSSKGKLVCFKAGAAKTLDCDALLVETVGKESLLIARKEKPPVVLGFNPVATTRLVLRGPDGQERILKKTGLMVAHAVPDAAGRNILVAANADWRARAMAGADTELEIVEVESGRAQALAGWKMVNEIVGIDDGWLVGGQPKDKPAGLYRMGADGQSQLLISGHDCHGVALVGDELIYSTILNQDGTASDRTKWLIRRVSLATVKKDGPAWQPFFGSLIQRIAVTAFEKARLNPASPDCLATRREFDAFMAIARTCGRELAGVDLPTTPQGVDELLADYAVRQDLKTEGVLLLSAILTQTLLDQKAEWRDETPSILAAGRGGPGSSENSAFAVAVAPGAIVASLLYDEESEFYHPATTVIEEAKGRPIILSRDPEALIEKNYGAAARDLRNLLKNGRLDEISGLLKKQSSNLHLRELVYEQLLASRPLEQLEPLASSFAIADAPLIDQKMLLAIQTARAGKGDQAKLIGALRAAITRFPEETAFYAMLGSVYEKSQAENSGECARKCYEAVLSIAKYGPLAQEAKAALARLDGKPAATDDEADQEEL